MNLSGHLWTIGDLARRGLTGPTAVSEPWRGKVEDPAVGGVRLTGNLHRTDGPGLVVILHGLGGSAQSPYAAEAAASCVNAGWSVLRLNLRGSDRSGEDYYHAGLTADLHAALASSALRGYRYLAIWGFSLGGHIALTAATETEIDSRVRAVAAVCAPLGLDACSRTIDQPSRWPYRRHMLRKLVELYSAVAERRSVPVPIARVRRLRSLREFDEIVVAPRFGFDSAADYYDRASVGPKIARLRIPALYVGSRQDPMVPASSIDKWLGGERSEGSGNLTVRWCRRGGHLGFPRTLDLGEKAGRGLYPQTVGWLARTADSDRA